MITVTFACGHEAPSDGKEAPTCHCGETRISRVKAPAPTVRIVNG